MRWDWWKLVSVENQTDCCSAPSVSLVCWFTAEDFLYEWLGYRQCLPMMVLNEQISSPLAQLLFFFKALTFIFLFSEGVFFVCCLFLFFWVREAEREKVPISLLSPQIPLAAKTNASGKANSAPGLRGGRGWDPRDPCSITVASPRLLHQEAGVKSQSQDSNPGSRGIGYGHLNPYGQLFWT